jgi:hypothetical protein
MNDLRHDLGIRHVVNAAHEVGEPGHIGVIADTQERARFHVVDRHRFDHDQPDSTFRVAEVAVGDGFVDEAVFARQPRDHGRDHDPVRQNHPFDVERFEQLHLRCSAILISIISHRRRDAWAARATSVLRRRP